MIIWIRVIPSNPQAAADEASSLRALKAGDLATARAIIRGWVTRDPQDLGAWLRLAGVARKAGQIPEAIEALDNALRIDPRCFPALLMMATVRESMGDTKLAAHHYSVAIAQAPPTWQIDPSALAAMEHGRALVERHNRELRDFIHAAIGDTRQDCADAERKRVDTFVDVTLRIRKSYTQQPMEFCYPGLPSIEFYDRAHFPWLERLEAESTEIRRELLSILGAGGEGFAPYINYSDQIPLDQWRELNRSPKWTAWHFFDRGEPIEAHCKIAPATAEAVSRLPQPKVVRRSPSALFSALTPRTRIPPHTGVANFRLLVHLPLILPPGCGFRVGGETREWKFGEAWVFDDTIEHEAWNNSDELRVIMICDVWSPLLSASEREAIAAVIEARDRYTGVPTMASI